MVVGFCSIGGWCYSGCDLRTLAQCQGGEMSPELFQDLGLSQFAVEHSVVAMATIV